MANETTPCPQGAYTPTGAWATHPGEGTDDGLDCQGGVGFDNLWGRQERAGGFVGKK